WPELLLRPGVRAWVRCACLLPTVCACAA
ncbi:hypothetical protein Q4I31_000418, partial [Leishmania lindenbergi]